MRIVISFHALALNSLTLSRFVGLNETMTKAPVIVYGEGSAAVFTVQELIQRNEMVVWATGTGAKLLPVMPFVKSDKALSALVSAQKFLTGDFFSQPLEKGLFHRVFRNKGFKLPQWKKTPNLEAQTQAYQDFVWSPEQAYVGVQEFRLGGLNPATLEQTVREKLEAHPHVTKVASAPVVELEVYEHGGKIQFANGFITEFSKFFFCDSLNELKSLPKLLTVLKHQMGNVRSSSMMSILQVVFSHSEALMQPMDTGLMIPLNREAGESFDRNTLGYFIEPTKSMWTVFLQPEEVEENHEIMKKLRKLKQALNKAFDSPEFLPEGKKEFMATVEKEQFRFEESYLATEGSFKVSKANSDFVLLTDAFGFSAALEKIADHFELETVSMEDAIETKADADVGVDMTGVLSLEDSVTPRLFQDDHLAHS